MTKAEEAKNWALEHVGCPYIYGATQKTCTPSYREARAKQYPTYRDKIYNNCPRLKGKATTCTNCKWCDPETKKGKLAYDCAQLTRWCMDSVDIFLVSGANSQWQKTDWEAAGDIGSIPTDKLCLVYREDSDGKKHHTGIYLGDGTIVHAKGHDYGVVRELLGNPKFTHWGIPAGLYSELTMTELKNGDQGTAVKRLQRKLNEYGFSLTVDGKFGPKTEAAVKKFQTMIGLIPNGICDEETWAKLYDEPDQSEDPKPPTEEQPTEEDDALQKVIGLLQEAADILRNLI